MPIWTLCLSSRILRLLPASSAAVEERRGSLDTLLTVSEVAPMVRMSEQALYAAIRERQFPAIRIGARIRISELKLREWIANGGTPLGGSHSALGKAA